MKTINHQFSQLFHSILQIDHQQDEYCKNQRQSNQFQQSCNIKTLSPLKSLTIFKKTPVICTQTTSKLCLLIIIFCYLLQKVNCVSPLDSNGMFYTQQLKIQNNLVTSSNSTTASNVTSPFNITPSLYPTPPFTMSFSKPYSGWTFTSASVNKSYVALFIQDININVDDLYLSFNITKQLISTNNIQIQIQFCDDDFNCFISVTFRMLAVDYDLSGSGNSYIADQFFIQTQTLSNQTYKLSTYNGVGNASLIGSQAHSFVFLSGFMIQSTSIFQITNVQANYNSSLTFNLSIQVHGSMSYYISTFTIITVRIYINRNTFGSTSLTSYNVFVQGKQQIFSSHQIQINYPFDSARPGYPIGQTLVFGMSDFYLKSLNILDLTSSIGSARVFNSTSSDIVTYQSGKYDNIWMKWFIIQKYICHYPQLYYVIDSVNGLTSCANNCNISYNKWNIYTCNTCLNSHCQSCDINQTTSCISCHSSRQLLSNATNINDCVPKYSQGYYQNELIIAGSCKQNCSSCANNQTCKTCKLGYYFTNLSQCLNCNDIFQNCNQCNNSFPSQCTYCQNFYYLDQNKMCQACEQNCSSCSNNYTCKTCQLGYYFTNLSQCLNCNEIFQNCSQCDYSIPSLCTQCQISYYLIQNKMCLTCDQVIPNCTTCDPTNTNLAVCLNCQIPFLVFLNSCQVRCGDGAIQFQQECDDGNLINNDGCNINCQKQLNFSCEQFTFLNYTNLYTSICIYTGEITIVSKYLEKFQTENKVEFRFNLLPKLAVFQTNKFAQRMINAFEVNWTGFQTNSLEMHRVQNGLQENGLFSARFSYDIQWSDSIELLLFPERTHLQILSYNFSRLLIEINQNFNDKQSQQIENSKLNIQKITSFNLNKRLLSGQTSSTFVLPSKSDNNLQMYSISYDIYAYSQYFSYFLISMICLMWVLGLSFGKLVVVDFIIALQIGVLCIMTTGILTPGYSGMMIQDFVFFGFTGFFSISYEDRTIYQPLSPQFKSAKISVHPAQNLNLMFIFLGINLLIGIIAKIINKFSSYKKYLIENILKYSFSQFNLYILLPFMVNGNVSTVIYMKSLFIQKISVSILDIIALMAFNIFQVIIFVMQYKRPKLFGQFRSEFLRFNISQEFYMFVMIYLFFVSIIFAVLFGTVLIKYCCILPILIYGAIIIFNKIKEPYLQSRHIIRSYLLYGPMILLILLIQIQNIANSTFLKNSLPVIVLVVQSILLIATCFYLFQSIRVQGLSKLKAFLQHGKQSKGGMALYDEQKQKIQQKIDEINRNYYQNQSKLLKDFKQLYKPTQFNFYQEYSNLGQYIEEHASPQNKNKPKLVITESDKQNMTKLLKDPKKLKMCLKSHMINQNSKGNLSPTYQDIYNTFQNTTPQKELKRQNKKDDYNQIKNETKKQSRLQDYKQARIQQNFDSNKDIEKQQDFPEQLITSYKPKKLQKISPRKAIVSQKIQHFYQNNFKQSQQKQPKQKLPVITYQLWLQQLQRQDQEEEKEKRMKEWQDKQWLQDKIGVQKQEKQKQKQKQLMVKI